jgi:ABC-type Mn2+/Zn2+ transport system permease subunit
VNWLKGTPFELIPWAGAAALLAGGLLPPLGAWIVMQRVVFLGVTLAQVAAAGVALGLLLHLPALPLGLLLCALAIAALTGRARGAMSGDAALGAGFCLASALALLFISRSPADLDQVSHVLHGNLLFALRGDVLLLGGALLAGAGVTLACHRPLLLCAFDPETAAALGLRVRGWRLLLFGVLAVVLTLGMQTTGSLLTFALLLLPPLAALQLRRGLVATLALSSLLGLAAAAGGLLAAVRADLHVESSIVVAACLLLPVARAWRAAPWLGLLLAAALAALVPLLAPEQPAAPGQRHEHPSGDPWHIDVHLAARPAGAGRVSLRWSLDVHDLTGAVPLPRELWLVVSAGGAPQELRLVADTGTLHAGEHLVEGEEEVDVAEEARVLSGQLWTGPLDDLDAAPVPHATVPDCPLP